MYDPICNPLNVNDEFHCFTMLSARTSFHVIKLKRKIKRSNIYKKLQKYIMNGWLYWLVIMFPIFRVPCRKATSLRGNTDTSDRFRVHFGFQSNKRKKIISILRNCNVLFDCQSLPFKVFFITSTMIVHSLSGSISTQPGFGYKS